MSRSRPPKCGCGRGCWVCGDSSETRRAREAESARIDLEQGRHELYEAHWDDLCPDYCTGCSFCDPSIEWWGEYLDQRFEIAAATGANDNEPLRVSFLDLARCA